VWVGLFGAPFLGRLALAGGFSGEQMAKIQLIAKRPFLYAGKRLASGAEFNARTHSDARLLIAIGHADFAPQGPVEPEEPQPWSVAQQPPETVAIEVTAQPVDEAPAEVLPVEEPASDAASTAPAEEAPIAKPRRQYRRRDLTAEGSE